MPDPAVIYGFEVLPDTIGLAATVATLPDTPTPQPAPVETPPAAPQPVMANSPDSVSLPELQKITPSLRFVPPFESREAFLDGRQVAPVPASVNKSPSQDDTSTDVGASLAEENADFGNFSVNGLDVVEGWTAVQKLAFTGTSMSAREVPIVDPSAPAYGTHEHYHWSGLLAQSLFFNVFENIFRAASDDQIRVLLANKPFWHDYIASTKQFNMRRWNDGDDFLVNYVGHPMQGAVSGFIEIQNDPVGRQLEIGRNPEYWKSRFRAFLWAVVYSTHSEISPLGEAGIGNEGGWTYPIRCKIPGCPNWNPAKMHSTNNTGWVDFTITPTVGMLWLLAEDTLDRFLGDWVQRGNTANLGAAFLRGGLNPSRSMANAMRLRAPWYRDFQHEPEVEESLVTRVQPSDEQLAELGPLRRISIAPFFHTMPFGSQAQPCMLCFAGPGIGVGLDIAITRWLSISLEARQQAGLLGKGSTAKGSTASIGYGVRFTHEGLRDNISIAVRPSLVIDQISGPLVLDQAHNTYVHTNEDVARTAVTIAVSNDFKVSKSIAVRYTLADTIVRYRTGVEDPPGIGKVPYLTWLSKDNYTNRSNWSGEAGPVFRF
jgi:hypothetical protein